MSSADDSTLHPDQGARFLFERQSQSDDQSHASYRAVVFTRDERFAYCADMDIDGRFTLAAQGPSASAELEQKLDTIAKLIARGAKKKRDDLLPPWPHRVLRWRGPGRG